MDNSFFVVIRHLDAPWIAADFAILNEAAVNVWLDIDFHLLATKRTCDNELVCHLRQSYCEAPSARTGGPGGWSLTCIARLPSRIGRFLTTIGSSSSP